VTSIPADLTRPAAFLDRDGTLVAERNFLGDPAVAQLLPGVAGAVRLLNAWGYWVIGVSNQSGVARGYYGLADVEAVNEKIIADLANEHAYINRIYHCPHHPAVQVRRGLPFCNCRKPATGMIERALSDYPIDLTQSFVVGDQTADVRLGRAVGIPGILVLTGFGEHERSKLDGKDAPDAIVSDLVAAVRWIGRLRGHPMDAAI
jgi:histidinol-phosphate phosphatase family protein